jgi:biopolymer transport protein ExbD
MKIRHTTSSGQAKVEMQMTPMIDIVFQLLTFFMFSFKIASVEGDFNIRMPLAAPSAGLPADVPLPPIRVRLSAGPDGKISGIRMGENDLKSFAELHTQIIGIIGKDTGPGSQAEGAEVELDCDYDLRYEHVVAAITAIAGYVDADGNVVKLIDKIKFAPPRGQP